MRSRACVLTMVALWAAVASHSHTPVVWLSATWIKPRRAPIDRAVRPIDRSVRLHRGADQHGVSGDLTRPIFASIGDYQFRKPTETSN